MTYYLRMKDHTGRGYKSLLPFETKEEREAHVVLSMVGDGADEDEVAGNIALLDMQETVEYEHTEYEYLVVSQ